MSEQEKKKEKRIHRLLRVGFVILVVVVALGPLALLVAYTWDIKLFEQLRYWPEQKVETAPEVLPGEPYMVQYLYRFCEHGSAYGSESVPPDRESPPTALVKMATALHKSDTNIQEIMSYLNNSTGWYVADMGVGSNEPCFTFTYLDDLCPDCEKHYYLGIYNESDEDLIAVFQGKPPRGKLIRITGHKVRDDLREKLKAGATFESLDELDSILEAYTS